MGLHSATDVAAQETRYRTRMHAEVIGEVRRTQRLRELTIEERECAHDAKWPAPADGGAVERRVWRTRSFDQRPKPGFYIAAVIDVRICDARPELHQRRRDQDVIRPKAVIEESNAAP